GPAEVEKLLRQGRAGYEKFAEPGKLLFLGPLECDHVDYKTRYFLYVPKSYDPAKASPLLLVGHGGNGAMSADYAKRAAQGGIRPWLPVADKHGMILAAPLTERGWGWIGDSIVLSLRSKLQRQFHVDPDRVCLTGHSMGGHLSWRSGIFMPDRWAGV